MKRIGFILCTLGIMSAHATTVNLNWVVDDANYANTTCETGGDLILPATPPAKYGYTFKGWNILLGFFLNNIDYQSDWSVSTYDGVVTYQTDEATFSLTRTPSDNFGLRGSPSFSLRNRANHKFYITYQIYLSNVAKDGYAADANDRLDNIQYLRDDISWNKANVWQTASFLATVPANELPYQLQGYPMVATSHWDVGDYYKIRKYRVFDLTEIFGVGNEPSNLKDIEEALSSRYITESTPGACNFAKTDTYLYAEYTPNSHTCSTGYYLPANVDECTLCPAGSKCVGGTYTFNETVPQGIEPCATGYSSVAGASVCTPNTITIIWDNASATDIAANDAGTVTYGGDIRTPKKAQHINGKIFVGWSFNNPE